MAIRVKDCRRFGRRPTRILNPEVQAKFIPLLKQKHMARTEHLRQGALRRFRAFQNELRMKDVEKELSERDAFIMYAYSSLNDKKQSAGPVTTLYYALKDDHTRHGVDTWVDDAGFAELLKGARYRQGFDKLTRGVQERYPWDYLRASQLISRLVAKGATDTAAGALLMFHCLLRAGGIMIYFAARAEIKKYSTVRGRA